MAVADDCLWQGVELGDLTEMVANLIMVPLHSTVHSHNPIQWNMPRTDLPVGVTSTKLDSLLLQTCRVF